MCNKARFNILLYTVQRGGGRTGPKFLFHFRVFLTLKQDRRKTVDSMIVLMANCKWRILFHSNCFNTCLNVDVNLLSKVHFSIQILSVSKLIYNSKKYITRNKAPSKTKMYVLGG